VHLLFGNKCLAMPHLAHMVFAIVVVLVLCFSVLAMVRRRARRAARRGRVCVGAPAPSRDQAPTPCTAPRAPPAVRRRLRAQPHDAQRAGNALGEAGRGALLPWAAAVPAGIAIARSQCFPWPSELGAHKWPRFCPLPPPPNPRFQAGVHLKVIVCKVGAR
jgi:hypothetical protein